MTIISSSLARCRPGRRDDFMAIALEGMKLFERHGARHTRLFEAMTSGEHLGQFVLTNEFSTSEAYGVFLDELYSDAEFESFMKRVTDENSPLLLDSRSLATEIPLDRQGSNVHGSVIEVYVSRVVLGRFETACELTTRAFDFLERNGATNCRLTQLRDAGASTGALVATWEFPNMRTRGKADDAWMTDASGKSVIDEVNSAAAPLHLISSGLYRDVHM